MTTINRPETKLTYGMCYNATHMHREVMEGNYTICDHTAQYWPSTVEAQAYESAKIMACATGSVGATQVQQNTKGEVVTEQHWSRPKHSHPFGYPESSWVKSHILDEA